MEEEKQKGERDKREGEKRERGGSEQQQEEERGKQNNGITKRELDMKCSCWRHYQVWLVGRLTSYDYTPQ